MLKNKDLNREAIINKWGIKLMRADDEITSKM